VSDAVAAVRAHLADTGDVTDLVSTRLYYDNLPQNATLPAIVLWQSGDELVRNLATAEDLHRAVVHVDIYADTHTTLVSVGEAAEAAIEMQSGTWGTITVQRAYVETIIDGEEPPRDGSDQFRRVRSMVCPVWTE